MRSERRGGFHARGSDARDLRYWGLPSKTRVGQSWCSDCFRASRSGVTVQVLFFLFCLGATFYRFLVEGFAIWKQHGREKVKSVGFFWSNFQHFPTKAKPLNSSWNFHFFFRQVRSQTRMILTCERFSKAREIERLEKQGIVLRLQRNSWCPRSYVRHATMVTRSYTKLKALALILVVLKKPSVNLKVFKWFFPLSNVFAIYNPDAPCMEYSPTFTPKHGPNLGRFSA